jgi:hypothetical protein
MITWFLLLIRINSYDVIFLYIQHRCYSKNEFRTEADQFYHRPGGRLCWTPGSGEESTRFQMVALGPCGKKHGARRSRRWRRRRTWIRWGVDTWRATCCGVLYVCQTTHWASSRPRSWEVRVTGEQVSLSHDMGHLGLFRLSSWGGQSRLELGLCSAPLGGFLRLTLPGFQRRWVRRRAVVFSANDFSRCRRVRLGPDSGQFLAYLAWR